MEPLTVDIDQVDARIAAALAERGIATTDLFLPRPALTAARDELLRLRQDGLFHRARVSRGSDSKIEDEIRRDRVLWFEQNHLYPAQEVIWQRLEALRQSLNKTLFLGLQELEGHYAHYPPGGFYHRHLDRFRSDDARVVSCVLYLNENWVGADGGELKYYVTPKLVDESSEQTVLIEPKIGTFVCFLSAEIEHEVLPSNKDRLSFAGWFKRRS